MKIWQRGRTKWIFLH